jgi:NDP-sugar pyrophosphorylase family protein
LNLLLTAAGAGSRFRREGLATPKPLIRVRGRELLLHTLDSFRFAAGDRLLLGVQRSDGVRERMEGRLGEEFPGLRVEWVELDELLPGQLATAIACLEESRSLEAGALEEPLLIHNCDTGFTWPRTAEAEACVLFALGERAAYGSMAVFEAQGEHWSFGLPAADDPQRAIEIREKQRISPLASIGLYGFRSGAEFLRDARSWIRTADPLNGEHYVAPLLQAALERQERVLLPRVEGVRLYGTPAELCRTFAITREELLASNSVGMTPTLP